MTASNDSDPHRKNGAKNLKLLFSGITCVLYGLQAMPFSLPKARTAHKIKLNL